MYLATTDTATAKASPGVFAAKRDEQRGSGMALLLLILKLAPPVTAIITALLGYFKDR
ncbi:hypothetical protein P9423_21845 [Enterobacter mori]|uniref:hypothetical protein n=1 Tax=Enterobacter mori TaxID=539813 RepID=UPI00389256B7